MRFHGFGLGTLLLAAIAPLVVSGQTLPVVKGNICENVNIVVPLQQVTCITVATVTTCALSTVLPVLQVTVAENVCLCASGNALTPASIASIDALVRANGTGVRTLTSLTSGILQYTAATLNTTILNQETNILINDQPTCGYPTNAIPDSCSGNCHYTCPNNGYVCGTQCVPSTYGCNSGVPVPGRKRTLARQSDFLCSRGYSACAIPGARPGRKSFECLDTSSDVESCGGCAVPLPGGVLGTDCTAIPNAIDIACVSGECQISRCARGYTLSQNGTACVDKHSEPLIASADKIVAQVDDSIPVPASDPNSFPQLRFGGKSTPLKLSKELDDNEEENSGSQIKREKREFIKRFQVDTRALRTGSLKKKDKKGMLGSFGRKV